MNKLKMVILSIDAWRTAGEGWTWNNSFEIKEVFYDEKDLTSRKILRFFRKQNLLSASSIGRIRLEIIDFGDRIMYELQDKNTREPLFAFMETYKE